MQLRWKKQKMENESKYQGHNSLLTIVVGIIVAIGRIKLEEKNTDDLIIIMSVVNTVAFGFVIVLILNDIYNSVKLRITNSGVSTATKKINKRILEILFLSFFAFFAYLGIYYVTTFKSAKYNDAMSIIALAFSIATDGFVNLVSTPTYRFVLFINKSYEKINNKFKSGKFKIITLYKQRLNKDEQ